jgi:pimeloyl-ACP methyl ester carboxylesterase
MIYVNRLFVLFALLLLVTAPASSAEIESRFAKFNDTRVHYLSRGKGDEALIFVHGWTCNAEFWRPQMNDFPGLRLIAVDLIGHGQSDKPHVTYTIEYFARSIEAVLRDAHIKRAVLVGHSMGTPVIQQFYRLFPEKTAGLVMVDGGLKVFLPKEQMDQLVNSLRSNYQTAEPAFVDVLVGPIKDEKLRSEIRTAMLAAPDYVGISAMEAMADERSYGNAKIMVPVLAILAKSPFWGPDTETFLRSLVPNLDFRMWDGVSHFLMMERPQEFDRAVQEFLTKNELLKKDHD